MAMMVMVVVVILVAVMLLNDDVRWLKMEMKVTVTTNEKAMDECW